MVGRLPGARDGDQGGGKPHGSVSEREVEETLGAETVPGGPFVARGVNLGSYDSQALRT